MGSMKTRDLGDMLHVGMKTRDLRDMVHVGDHPCDQDCLGCIVLSWVCGMVRGRGL